MPGFIECNCRNVEKLYKRNSFRTIQIDKFSISLEKLKNKYEGMLQLSCILSQDDVMEFAEELFENKSCTVLFNLKVLGLHAFFKMD